MFWLILMYLKAANTEYNYSAIQKWLTIIQKRNSNIRKFKFCILFPLKGGVQHQGHAAEKWEASISGAQWCCGKARRSWVRTQGGLLCGVCMFFLCLRVFAQFRNMIQGFICGLKDVFLLKLDSHSCNLVWSAFTSPSNKMQVGEGFSGHFSEWSCPI